MATIVDMRDNDQSYLSSWGENARFTLLRGRGHTRRYLQNRFKWHIYPRFGWLPKFPDHIDVEICSSCNMRCPMCFTITDEFRQNVNLTIMRMDLFRKIIDEAVRHNAFSIRLSWRGEPTMNPHMEEMALYAKEQGICEVSTLTNALKLTPERFEKLMHAGLDWLTISFDGMGETYNKIRKPAKFDEQVEKIREFKRIKDRAGKSKPVVKIQGIWPAIKENPQEFYDLFRPIVDQVAINPLLDYLREDDDIEYRERFTCPVLWQRMAIGADGLVPLCIHDEMAHHIIADVKEMSIYDIWNSPELTAARKAHVEHKGVETYKACKECFLPRASEPELMTLENGRNVAVDNMINRPNVVGTSKA